MSRRLPPTEAAESKPQPNGRFGWGPGYRALLSGKTKAPLKLLGQKMIRLKTKDAAPDLERCLISGGAEPAASFGLELDPRPGS